MKWLLAGASGFLGTALRVRLATDGHEVVRLVRREPATATEYGWDPDTFEIDTEALDGVDVVVNLCGVGVANWVWTPERRKLLRSSRVNPSRTLAAALADRAAAGTAPVLIQAGGIASTAPDTASCRTPRTHRPAPTSSLDSSSRGSRPPIRRPRPGSGSCWCGPVPCWTARADRSG